MYLGECRDRGIPVLSPDINESQLGFSVERGRGVRFGLTAIKGLGEGAIRSILDARARLGGRITSLHELCEILDMRLANKRVFEALVKSGACDSLGKSGGDIAALASSRARLFAAIESACEHGARTQRDKDLGQTDLFASADGEDGLRATVSLPNVPPWTEMELLNHERDTLGLFLTGHPIDRWADDLRGYGARSIADLGLKKEPELASDALTDEEGGGASTGAGLHAEDPRTKGGSPHRVSEEISIGGIAPAEVLNTRKGDRMCVFMLKTRTAASSDPVSGAFKQFGHLARTAESWSSGQFEKDEESPLVRPTSCRSKWCARRWPGRPIRLQRRHTTEPRSRSCGPLRSHKGDRRVAFVIEEQTRKSVSRRCERCSRAPVERCF